MQYSMQQARKLVVIEEVDQFHCLMEKVKEVSRLIGWIKQAQYQTEEAS